AAGAHARPQQRRACRRLAEESDAIALDPPAIVVAAPDLLGAGPRGLALRTLAPRDAGVGLQLVDRVERRRVAGRVERGDHPETVDRRAVGQQLRDAVLVEVAAGEND